MVFLQYFVETPICIFDNYVAFLCCGITFLLPAVEFWFKLLAPL